MPSEKFFVHKEDGSLVRLKGRLVRFLDEEPPTGSDKSAIRTALEVSPDAEGLVQADVGTDPNQLVLHQHLGDISYQSADSVAVDTLEVTDKVKGPLGIDGSPGSYAYSGADDLVVGDASGSRGITISTGSSDTGALYFGDAATTGLESYRGMVRYSHSSDSLELGTLSQVRATIDSSGNVGIGSAPAINLGGGLSVDGGSGYVNLNLVKGSSGTGHAVDFSDENGALQFRVGTNFSSGGSNLIFARGTGATIAWKIDSATGNLVANGTAIDFGSGGTLSDYEEGYHETTVGTDGTGSITLYASHDRMTYTKIGNIIQINGMLAITSVSSPTGNVTFSLPVPVPTLTDNAGYVGGAVYFQDYGTSNTTLPFRCVPGTSTMTVYVDSSTLAADDKFAFSFTYRTTAS